MNQTTLTSLIFVSIALCLLIFFIIKETRSRRKVKKYLEHYKGEAGIATKKEEMEIKKVIKKKEFDFVMNYRKPQLCGAIHNFKYVYHNAKAKYNKHVNKYVTVNSNLIIRIVKRLGGQTYCCMVVKKGKC
ncbi:MAG: hypothetical protein WC707_06870 [Candidatus Babeliaceae bacterium]|jgi:hypothetical protein